MSISRMALAFAWATLIVSMNQLDAQDFERYRPRPFNTPQGDIPSLQTREPVDNSSDKVLVESLDAVIIVDSRDKIEPKNAFADSKGLTVDFGEPDSLVNSDAMRTVVESYIGEPISLRALSQLSRDIIRLYRGSDQPVVDVQIPEQRITGGTVQIIVIESRVGDVQVEGGPFFDPGLLSKWVWSTQSGSRVYESFLMDDLFWLNQSSFRRVEVDLRPGQAKGTTDIIFRSNEVRPWRSYIGYEDSGVRSLDLERIYGGIIWGNAFGRGGTLSYQYTGNAKFDKLHAHAVTWDHPFNRMWSGQLGASWAGFEPFIPAAITQQGESWLVGSKMIRHLVKNQNNDISINFGSDFKSTNNNLEFGGVNVVNTSADLVNFRMGFQSIRRENNQFFFIANDLFIGPGGGFSSDHNAAAFSTIRAATSPDYVYNRLRTQALFDMGDFQLVVKGVGQYAFDRVLFSETLGLGGYDSIRGYDQRVFSGDSGWITNIEFGLKPIEMGTIDDPSTLNVFTFFDAGKAFTRNTQAGEFNDLFLMSVGAGLRWTINQDSSLRIDYGHGMEKAPGIATRDRVHIGYVRQFGPRPSRAQAQ